MSRKLKEHPAGFKWTQIGPCRMVLGDCLKVLPKLKSESVDMVWTDPPYGHNNMDGDFLSNRHKIMQDGREMRQKPIENDSQDTMRLVVGKMLDQASRILKRDCCCCCCCCGGGGPRPTFAWVANRMDCNGMQFFHSVIWDKKNPGIGLRYRRQHEMVMERGQPSKRKAFGFSV